MVAEIIVIADVNANANAKKLILARKKKEDVIVKVFAMVAIVLRVVAKMKKDAIIGGIAS